jgi:hypothetical protein
MRQDEEYRLAAARHRRRRQVDRLLAPRWTPRQLARFHRSRWGGADRQEELEASLVRDFGPMTDAECALEARISREHKLVERALLASAARETMRSLAQHIERTYHVPYVKDLTDDQLEDFERWVVGREELAERRRRADS